MSKVKKLRLTVYRSWNQISVKDFECVEYSVIQDYVKNTWSDVVKIRVKIIR